MSERAYPREEFQQPVAIELGATGMQTHGCGTGEGMGVDISSAGVGITSSIPLQGGEVVLLTLPVGELGARIPVYAEVVWQQPQRGAFRTGLRFLA